MIPSWQRRNNTGNIGVYITIFGILLLFLKLVNVPVGISYFLILCIIFWPMTIIVSALCILVTIFILRLVFEWIKEKI